MLLVGSQVIAGRLALFEVKQVSDCTFGNRE